MALGVRGDGVERTRVHPDSVERRTGLARTKGRDAGTDPQRVVLVAQRVALVLEALALAAVPFPLVALAPSSTLGLGFLGSHQQLLVGRLELDV